MAYGGPQVRKNFRVLSLTSHDAKVQFRKDSMRIRIISEDVLRRIMGDDLPEGILNEMVEAIPTLLCRMRNLAMTPGRVVPDTARMICCVFKP
jgi:hypothetical protein